MRRSGPCKKPTALKLLEGNPGKQKLTPETEPQFTVEDTDAPVELNDVAQRIYLDLAPELRKLGMLNRASKYPFAIMCSLIGAWAQAEKRMREEGMTQEGKFVTERSVSSRQVLEFANAARGYIQHFGITPASAADVVARVVEEADPFDAI